MSLKSRLRRLEEHRSSGRCDGCGFYPDSPGRIVLDQIPEGEPEHCPECGRYMWCVIEVVYDSPSDTERGGDYRWP